LWRQYRLQVPRISRRRRLRKPPAKRLIATHPGHIWAYDFVEDALANGTPLRILTVMDEFTREGLALDVDVSASAERVLGVLAALIAQHGAPAHLRSDNGPEFVATAVKLWLAQRGVQTLYIDAGKPWQNGKEERFNGTVRDECLNMHAFASLAEAWMRLSAFQRGQAIRATFIDILEEEVSQFIGASRYERTAERRDQRAGHRTRTLGTTAGVIDDLPVPRTRGGFHTQLFERYQRRMTEVDTLMRDMFVGGVSQQSVGTLVEKVTGTPASASTASRVFHTLEAEFATWQKRQLPKRYVYAFADGTYFSVIYDGEGQKMPILALIGITSEGQREVIALTTGECENQGAWENLLADIKARGVETVDL
jgi:transposase InsO family protein